MFIGRSLSSVRGRALLLAILPLLSLLTLFTPLFTHEAAAISPGDLSKKAEVWRGIGGIISRPQGVKNKMSVSDAAACNYVEEAAAEGDSIYGPRLTNENLKVIGLTCTDFFKTIGFTPPSGAQSTFNKPGGFSADGVASSLAGKGITGPNTFYGGDIRGETPSDGLVYEIAMGMLKSQCTVGFRTELLNPIPSYNENADNNQRVDWMRQGGGNTALNTDSADTETNYHFWMWSYENNKVSKNIYHGGDRMDDYFEEGFGIRPITEYQTGPRDAGKNYEVDCYQPARLLQDNKKYADAYEKIIKPGAGITPGTCADRYAGKAAELAACDAGFKNKTIPGFCSTTYAGDAKASEREACQYGLGALGGADTVTPPPSQGNGENPATNKTTCNVESIGWIVCPVVIFLSKITDGAYTLVDELLVVEPLSLTIGRDNGIFNAWSIMRNFANIAFVIFFLVIIFSQLTSVGINNYGIKKLLPKLVVAAILVNISYWLCALAVDISNIIGGSIKPLLENIQVGAGVDKSKTYWADTSSNLLGGSVAAFAGGVVLYYTTLSVLLPMLVVVLATIVSVFLALVLRQALIILLIVISPLAFVAYLLPNTESATKTWWSTFRLLLLIYPIVGFVFGGAALASTIIMASAPNTWYIQIAGAAAAVIPLVAAPAMISSINKVTSRFGLPGVGVKLSGLQKGAEGYRDYRKDKTRGRRVERADAILGGTGGALGGEYSRRRRLASLIATGGVTRAVDRDKKRGYAKAVAEEGSQAYFAKRALEQEGFAAGIAGSAESGLKASAQSAVDKIKRQDIENREKLLTVDVKFKNDPQRALDEALKGGDHIQASAAINMLMKTGAKGFDKIHDSLTQAEQNPATSAKMLENMRDHIKDNGQIIKAKDPSLIKWASGGAANLASAAADASTFNKSDAELVGFSPKAFQDAASKGLIDRARAQLIIDNPSLYKDVSPDNKIIIESIAAGNPLPPAPPR